MQIALIWHEVLCCKEKLTKIRLGSEEIIVEDLIKPVSLQRHRS